MHKVQGEMWENKNIIVNKLLIKELKVGNYEEKRDACIVFHLAIT